MSNFVFFWKINQPNGEFSNWYMSPFTVEGITYCCCEQYMMAKKALLFRDTRAYNKIMGSSDPSEIKGFGKQVTPFDTDVWNKVREEVVYNANLAKFTQNPDLKEKLIKTGEAVLAEASPLDDIWGIKMAVGDSGIEDPANWKGQNLLGKTLMRVRNEIKD